MMSILANWLIVILTPLLLLIAQTSRTGKDFAKGVVETVLFLDKDALAEAKRQSCIVANTADPVVAEYMYLRLTMPRSLPDLINQAKDKSTADKVAGAISVWTYNHKRKKEYLLSIARDADERDARMNKTRMETAFNFTEELGRQMAAHTAYIAHINKLIKQASLNARIEDYYGSTKYKKAVEEAVRSVGL